MKERGILMSGQMVRAIMRTNGTPKTQTRRIVKPQPRHTDWPNPWTTLTYFERSGRAIENGPDYPDGAEDVRICPYGVAGDRLWVREHWRVGKGYDEVAGSTFTSPTVWYAADGDPPPNAGRFRHGRFMPRWASRITLEVTDVRVERLQDISQEDAMAEGAPPSHPAIDAISREYGYEDWTRSWYAQLWDHINGPGAWALNPWVWAVSFRRNV